MHVRLERYGWSLATRLWSMLFVVLAFVMAAFGMVAYTEARDATIDAVAQSLDNTARETAGAVSRSVVARLTVDGRLASGAPVLRALRNGAPPGSSREQALTAYLQREMRVGDTITIARQLVARDGRIAFALGAPDSAAVAALAPLLERLWRGDSMVVSPIFARGTRAAIWLAVAVRSEGRTIGALAQQVALGGSVNTQRAVSRLTGAASRVFYVNEDAREWLNAEGYRSAPLVDSVQLAPGDLSAPRRVPIDRVLHHLSVVPIAATPWLVVISQREDATLGRVTERGRRLAVIALALLALGTLGIVLVARRETEPLETVRAAADAMARGDTPPTLTPHGASETVSLIRSFNRMADTLREGRAELEARNVSLQQANDAKARFLAVMSHELRTPLHAIAGHTELIAMGIHGPVTDAQRHALDRIEHNNQQLLHLVTDVLHFSRQDALPLPMHLTAVELPEVFGALLENVRHEAEQKRIAVTMVPANSRVLADRQRLQQVLGNLLANALRFTPAGGSVRVQANGSDTRVRISVQDTGIGIAADKVARIFEPFVQLDEGLTRSTGGAGLGLAIVRQLTEAMGGTVSVDSVLGQGSTFAVELPMAPAHAEDIPEGGEGLARARQRASVGNVVGISAPGGSGNSGR
jgi:signal transduction histidine kinase